MKRIIVFVSILPVLIGMGCGHEISKPLKTKVVGENLCIFTNDSKKRGKTSFSVHTGKIDYTKEYKSEYAKPYKDTDFPTSRKNCAHIPLNEIKKNIAYTVTLNIGRDTYRTEICILEKENQPTIHIVPPGESTCN